MTRKQQMRIRHNVIAIALRILFALIAILIIFFATKGIRGLLYKSGNNRPTSQASADASADATDVSVEYDQRMEGFTVCVDAGHGGNDGGSTNADESRLEKNDTLNLAEEIKTLFEQKGATVIMTRESDEYVSLEDRCAIANNANANYFLSIHRNTGEDANGVEIWLARDADDTAKAYGNNIMSALENVGISRNRGVSIGSRTSTQSNYYVNGFTQMASCIVELGFMTSDEDNQLYDEHLQEYAKAIVEAVCGTYTGDLNADGSSASSDATNANGASVTAQGTEVNGTITSQKITNTEIVNVDALDSENITWKVKKNYNSSNIPKSCLDSQNEYGSKYPVYFIGDNSLPTVYLTFDATYENGNMESILDTLKEKGVSAVFFCTKSYMEEQPDIVNRIISEGHELANRSSSSPQTGISSLSVEEQKAEITQAHEYALENFGYEMHLFRFPNDIFSEQSLAIVNNCNYKGVFWTYSYDDGDPTNQPDTETALTQAVSRLHAGAIYRFRAQSSTSASILGDFIDQAEAQGYSFELLQ
jgi:N-acetylmuramoyl-L-alanine amidase/peptidoglycan/xylan/chitin deacetylase (PgdA/CDA1 family)